LSICQQVPDAAKRLVAANGDGFSANVVYRDGAFAWPAEALPVPLLLFAHNNPMAWDETGPAAIHPNETDDVLHFALMMQVVTEGVFPPPGGFVTTATDLATRLRGRTPPFFDPAGNRLGGSGEYVLLHRPRNNDRDPPGIPAVFSAFTRPARGADWVLVDRLALPAGPAPVRVVE
jgi:hypothetical protein